MIKVVYNRTPSFGTRFLTLHVKFATRVDGRLDPGGHGGMEGYHYLVFGPCRRECSTRGPKCKFSIVALFFYARHEPDRLGVDAHNLSGSKVFGDLHHQAGVAVIGVVVVWAGQNDNIRVPAPDAADDLKTRTVDVIEAAPEDLDLEEADIIVACGRGIGKGEAFDVIHELARAIGGSVGGTRPIIDWGALPYERQIGQTGKYVSPRLIINCGISGANEYTAGMEKSQQIIAIDINPRARMFRFADLGVVGDAHEILPSLIERVKELKDSD